MYIPAFQKLNYGNYSLPIFHLSLVLTLPAIFLRGGRGEGPRRFFCGFSISQEGVRWGGGVRERERETFY